MKGKGYWFGKIRNKETRDKISKTLKEKGIRPSIIFYATGEDHPNWKGGPSCKKDERHALRKRVKYVR